MDEDPLAGLGRVVREQAGRILVVGCEPASVEYGMELSEPVAAAVDEAVRIVLDMVSAVTTPDTVTTADTAKTVKG